MKRAGTIAATIILAAFAAGVLSYARCGTMPVAHRACMEQRVPVDVGPGIDEAWTSCFSQSFKAVRPLHVALLRKNWPAARCLLEHGADPNSRDGYGRSPLMMLCQQDSPGDLIALAIERGAVGEEEMADGSSALEHAIFRNNAAHVRVLLQAGVRVNRADADRRSPLVSALLQNADDDIIEQLLERSAVCTGPRADVGRAAAAAEARGVVLCGP